jgi:hypothetical protein
MNVQNLLRSLIVYGIVLVTILPAGCSKNEEPVQEAEFSGLYLQAITTDQLRLKVMDGERELTNALMSPGNRLTVLSTYYDPKRRIKVYNFYGDALLLDTLITFKGNPYVITFYQDRTGEALRWIGPPVNESLAGDGKLKVSIIYTAPLLPPSMRIVVENAVSETSNVYAATDSFMLDKGTFSKYFIGRNLKNRKPRLQMFSTGPERKLVATVSADKFVETNPDFSIFLFDRASGGGVFSLDSKKLY